MILLVVAAALSSCVGIIKTKRQIQSQEADWFDAACYWTEVIGYDEVDCDEIDRPGVVISRVVVAYRGRKMLGFYFRGEPYVFVQYGMSPQKTDEVSFHEAVHYILYETYGNAVGRCESEEAARKTTDLYMERPYNPAWKEWYDC
jgi:hypothetical protein